MPTAKELRSTAAAVLTSIPSFAVLPLKKLRRRGTEMMTGACYYGTTYFNHPQVAGNAPEFQLTKRAPTGLLYNGNMPVRIWVLGFGDLCNLVRKPVSYFLGWNHYSYTFIEDGIVLVTLSNFPEVFSKITSTTGFRNVFSCQSLADGRAPEFTWNSCRGPLPISGGVA